MSISAKKFNPSHKYLTFILSFYIIDKMEVNMKLTQTLTHKFVLFALLICFALTQLLFGGVFAGFSAQNAFAAEPNAVEELPLNDSDIPHFFYNQLGNEQKAFYEAMEEMYKSGKFARGEDFDLTDGTREYVSQQQLKAYANGDQTILKVLGGARDAFYTDYDDIFYVDFGYLSLRVTQSGSRYHAYLGSGRAETYYVKGFTSEQDVRNAISQYDTKINEVVAASKAAEPTKEQIEVLGQDTATLVAQIREAHKLIALTSVYKLESNCTPGNEGHIRTPYGVFVKGEALCEGYSRAFKAVMDKLDVPCVLINGAYRQSENQQELHMWTYVKIDGAWYAVDQTFDDVNGKKPDYGVQVGEDYNYEYTEDYFLKGAAVMNANHATSPYKSEAEFPFQYPTLSDQNIGGEATYNHGLFHVVQTPHTNDMNSTDITVSVFIDGEWCGYRDAAAKGYYLLMRHEGDYLPELLAARRGDFSGLTEDGEGNTYLVWGYVNPVPGMYDGLIDEYDGYTLIRNESKSTGFEFAVTTVPPREYIDDYKDQYTADQAAEMFTYLGDPTMFVARSGLIDTKYGDPTYQPQPHIVRSTPTIQNKLMTGGYSYNIKVEYDQLLELIPNKDGTTPELEVTVYGMRATGEVLKGKNAVTLDVIKSEIEWYPGELTEDGKFINSYIAFKFQPSELYAHDNIEYFFNFNLRGVNSGKQIYPITYAAGYPCMAMCYLAYGYHWNVFGQPQLMENTDLSMNDWETADGTPVGELEKMKDRLALVVTAPSQKQEADMNGLLEKELDMEQGGIDEDGFQSYTYNISLTICKAVVLQTGQGVRVCVGFPEDFDYNDSLNGVTFKAYHFKRDPQNNIIGVEEIECTVTPLGLILLCKSFSPFAIVVTNDSETDVNPNSDKTVIISASNGGTAFVQVEELDKETNTTKIVDSKLFSMKSGDKRELNVVANDGYVIESIKIGSKVITLVDASKIIIPIDYDSLEAQNVIQVNFVAKTVKEAEAVRGESAVVQHDSEKDVVEKVQSATVTVNSNNIALEPGKELRIEASVNTYGQNATYQWYKDGVALQGQTGTTLVIANATAADSGRYTLRVTTMSGTTQITSEVAVDVVVEQAPVDPAEDDGGFTEMQKIILISVAAGLVGLFVLLTIISIVVSVSRKKRYKK